MKRIIVKETEYIDINYRKPKEGEKVWVIENSGKIPRLAVYRTTKFLDISDEKIELRPTKWKYPNVPIFF